VKMENKNLEYKNLSFEIKEFNNDDPDYFYFEGYGSTFGNIDRGNDVVVKGAFVESLKGRMPKLLWQHKMDMPIGVFVDAYEDEKGLYVKGKMPRDDKFVSDRIIPQMKIGSVNDMSIGFSIKDADYEKYNGANVRMIKSVDLYEVSLVTIPMNPEAAITSKAFTPFQDGLPIYEKEYAWVPSEALERVQKELPADQQKTAFLFYDEKKQEGVYQIADIVDGELQIIPKALFLASAAIKGRKSVDGIDDISMAVESINKYYEKIDGVDSPLQKNMVQQFEQFGHIKDASDFLKAYGLSNQEATAFLACVKKIQDKKDIADRIIDAEKKAAETLLSEIKSSLQNIQEKIKD